MRVLIIAVCVVLVLVIGTAIWLYTPDASRASLEARYLTPADSYVDAAGIRLHVRDTGPRDAPTLIMLHGFADSLETFEPWARLLSPHYRVVRVDLPGFGLTGPDPTGDYSDAPGIAVLRALMDRLGVARAVIMGNSMGGRLAWQFAAAEPSRVAKLVLISPDGFASPGFAYGKAPEVPLMMRALPYTLPAFMVRASLAPAFADPALLSGAMVTRYRDLMIAPGVRQAIIDRLRQAILQDPEPALRSIKAPTLLLWGEQDKMIPFANSADYLRDIPDARLAALPGLGHVPQEEAPERSLAPVLAFLEQ
jgi:pimeloyl-ACP methyl ester carboxylesterase